ncbi:MAG: adenylate/guanylate cyclase domain-containing protein [Spirochaetaceae bacterium]|jgi:adenylate cyclase|nr:adenylate/guanylate cyclase domain-containing protein [Spirochaetaceae bacterium]
MKSPLAFKLIAVITALLFVCFTLITGFATFLVRRDLHLAAEDNNFAANRRTAANVQRFIGQYVSNADFLLEIAAGRALSERERAFFFRKNRDIIALALPPETFIVQDAFFLAYNIDAAVVTSFLGAQTEAMGKAAYGHTQVVNASPYFQHPVTAVFFQQEGGRPAVVFLSYHGFAEIFEGGANASTLITDTGSVLLSDDTDLMLGAANLFDDPFVRATLENGEVSLQRVYANGQKTYFGAFQKLSGLNAALITTIAQDIAFEGISAITRRNLYIALIVLVAAFVFVWFWIRAITRPVRLVTAASARACEGNYNIHVAVSTNDEIQALCGNVCKLSALGAERERLIDALGKLSNKAMVKKALHGRVPLAGKEADVSVLYLQLRSWPLLVQDFDAAAIVQIINMFFTFTFDCIQKTGGTVIRFSGSSILAVWGAPEKNGDKKAHARAALNSALLLRGALAVYNTTRRPILNWTSGIDSGPAWCGTIGTKERMEWTVTGLPVMNARWAESEAGRLGADTIVSDAAKTLAGKEFLFEKIPACTVKNKRSVMESWALLGRQDDTTGARTLAQLLETLEVNRMTYADSV